MTTPNPARTITIEELEQVDRQLWGIEQLLGRRVELDPTDERAARALAKVEHDRRVLASILPPPGWEA